MKFNKVNIPQFLGLMTQFDASQVPLGAVLRGDNMAQLETGRLRRIPGIEALGKSDVDASTQIPLLFFVRGLGGSNRTLAIMLSSTTAKLWDYTGDAELTGGGLTGAFGQVWSHTFYNQKHIVCSVGNSPKELDSATSYITLVGTNVPTGSLCVSYLDRLYIAGIAAEPELVRFTDTLTFTFQASNLVNTKEIPGPVTALAVNAASTDKEGIETDLLIFKRNAIWAWNETRKDVISQVTGSRSPHTIRNTPAGLMFLGESRNKFSVFHLPVGISVEPIDIGQGLYDLLNGSSTVQAPHLAHATVDGRFYKLFYSTNGTSCNKEVWLDLQMFIESRIPIWYGPHSRGSVDFASLYEYDTGAAASRLELVRRGSVSVDTWFAEKADTSSGFVDLDGNTLIAFVDIPINVQPLDEEKVFDISQWQIAKQANVIGNDGTVELLAEDTSQGTSYVSFYDSSVSGIARVLIPLYKAGALGMVARDARLRLTHSLNKRLDILGVTIQYYSNEEAVGRVKAKISS